MNLEDKDYYQILGVPRSATKEEIREAYLEIARIYHPDSNYYSDIIDTGTDSHEQQIFKIVTAAYSTLNDEKRRTAYNSTLPDDENPVNMTQEQSDQMFSEAKTWHRSRMDEEEGKRKSKYRERKNTVSFQRPRQDTMGMSSLGRERILREQVAAETQAKLKRNFALLSIFILGIALGTVILLVIH